MFWGRLENQVWAKLGPEPPTRGREPEPPTRPAGSGTFPASFFAAFPGNSRNNVDPADPAIFFAFPGNAINNVGSAGSTLFSNFLEMRRTLAEKSSGMGPRKKFRNLQAWLGVAGQV